MAGIVWDDLIIALGTLASGAVTQTNSRIDSARENGFRVLRTDYVMGLKYTSSDVTDGPIAIGLNADASNTEIQEMFDADPQASFDRPANEKSSRPAWLLEVMAPPTLAAEAGLNTARGTVNIKWSLPEGAVLKWWAFNMDQATLAGGIVVHILAKHYGVWLKD